MEPGVRPCFTEVASSCHNRQLTAYLLLPFRAKTFAEQPETRLKSKFSQASARRSASRKRKQACKRTRRLRLNIALSYLEYRLYLGISFVKWRIQAKQPLANMRDHHQSPQMTHLAKGESPQCLILPVTRQLFLKTKECWRQCTN
jgi:hypothetical protein